MSSAVVYNRWSIEVPVLIHRGADVARGGVQSMMLSAVVYDQ